MSGLKDAHHSLMASFFGHCDQTRFVTNGRKNCDCNWPKEKCWLQSSMHVEEALRMKKHAEGYELRRLLSPPIITHVHIFPRRKKS